MSGMSVQGFLPQLVGSAPHPHALGLKLLGVDGDRVTIEAPYRPDLVGDADTGVLAGGVVTTVLDHVSGCAVWVKMDAFVPIATLDLRIDYMRAAKPGLPLKAEARCVKLTRSIAFVRATAYDEDPEDPVALAQSAFILNSDGERKAGANLKRSPK